ncbi:MAG: CrcB family protein [Halanaerobiales bacterium]|nr:CrcB family protein [Halanaerobiales bacterium]
MNYFFIILGGLIGGLIRYILSKLIKNKKRTYHHLLNGIGTFILGFILVYYSNLFSNQSLFENIILSSFISFSLFDYLMINKFSNRLYTKAARILFFNLFLGLVFFTLGNLIAQGL